MKRASRTAIPAGTRLRHAGRLSLAALWVALGGGVGLASYADEAPAKKIASVEGAEPEDEDLAIVHLGAAGLAAGPPVDAAVQQIIQQFQPVLDAELAFARQICGDIPIADRKAIKAAAESALQDVAKRVAQNQAPPAKLAGEMRAVTEPVAAVRDALLKVVSELLPREVSQRYRDEAARHLANRKRAAIGNIVARLDALLCLTKQQRIEMAASFGDHWDVAYEKWARFDWPNPYAPHVPNQILTGLSTDQLSIWNGLQKVDVPMMEFLNDVDPPPDDGWWGGEEEADSFEVPLDVRVLRLLKLKLE